jgi:hypothetical protein
MEAAPMRIPVLACLSAISLLAGDLTDFRQTQWGMTPAEVQRIEAAEPLPGTTPETMAFPGKAAGRDCTVFYGFENGRLVRAGYHFGAGARGQKTDAVREYESLKSLLTEKYGAAHNEQVIWLDELFKNSPGEYGLAAAIGHHRRLAQWDTERTEIQASLGGENSRVSLRIDYTSKEFRSREEQVKKEKLASEL